MFFDQISIGILRDTQDEETIIKEYNIYILSIFQSAEIILETRNKDFNYSKEFNDLKIKFQEELDKEIPDLNKSFEYLNELINNQEFKSLLDIYLNAINSSILEEVYNINPQIIVNFQDYLNQIQNEVMQNYITLFIKPGAKIVNDARIEFEIDAITEHSDN